MFYWILDKLFIRIINSELYFMFITNCYKKNNPDESGLFSHQSGGEDESIMKVLSKLLAFHKSSIILLKTKN